MNGLLVVYFLVVAALGAAAWFWIKNGGDDD